MSLLTQPTPHCWARPQAAHTQADKAGGGGVGRGKGGGPEGGMTGWEAGGTSEAGVRSQGVGGDGVGWVCDKVIKTFHDIRVCEVPRADH